MPKLQETHSYYHSLEEQKHKSSRRDIFRKKLRWISSLINSKPVCVFKNEAEIDSIHDVSPFQILDKESPLTPYEDLSTPRFNFGIFSNDACMSDNDSHTNEDMSGTQPKKLVVERSVRLVDLPSTPTSKRQSKTPIESFSLSLKLINEICENNEQSAKKVCLWIFLQIYWFKLCMKLTWHRKFWQDFLHMKFTFRLITHI